MKEMMKKYIRWVARIILWAMVWAILGVLLEKVADIDITVLASAVMGGVAALAFWED